MNSNLFFDAYFSRSRPYSNIISDSSISGDTYRERQGAETAAHKSTRKILTILFPFSFQKVKSLVKLTNKTLVMSLLSASVPIEISGPRNVL